MKDQTIDELERRSGALGIQSEEAKGLVYFVHPDDCRVAVAGQLGVCILTRKQAKAVVHELLDIMEHNMPEAG